MNVSKHKHLDWDIISLYNTGLSPYEIGNKFGLNPNTIRYRLVINGVRTRSKSASLVGRPKSEEHRKALSIVRKISEVAKGDRNPNWKGGITSQAEILRKSDLYEAWRIRVFQRDGYTCQGCGDDKGGNLEAHHILPRQYFSDQIFVDDNGLTLCEECHRKVHSKRASLQVRELRETPTVKTGTIRSRASEEEGSTTMHAPRNEKI